MHQTMRTIGFVLALWAIFLIALLPSGMMPDLKHGGALVICTANGAQTIKVDGDKNAPRHTQKTCPFAVLAIGTTLPTPFFALTLHHVWLQQQAYAPVHESTVSALFIVTAAPRGPPLFFS